MKEKQYIWIFEKDQFLYVCYLGTQKYIYIWIPKYGKGIYE
jgi:hypothetical protein